MSEGDWDIGENEWKPDGMKVFAKGGNREGG